MRRGRIKLAAVAVGATAALGTAHSVFADQVWLVNQTVTVPPIPQVLNVWFSCGPDGQGNEIVWVSVNGTPVIATLPGTVQPKCPLGFVHVGGTPGDSVTIQAYIDRPTPPPCAVQVGAKCVAQYPVSPSGQDTLVISVCVNANPCTVESIPV